MRLLLFKFSTGLLCRGTGFFSRAAFLHHPQQLSRLCAELDQLRVPRSVAGMGTTTRGCWHDSTYRGDRRVWLHLKQLEGNHLNAIVHVLHQIDALVQHVAQELLPLGVNLTGQTSIQYAVYDGTGARYGRHRDSVAEGAKEGENPRRIFTCLYYLNSDWSPEDGGQLRLHLNNSSRQCWDIAPRLDQFVMFQSQEVEHEVLPCYRERKALTVWYYGHDDDRRRHPEKEEHKTDTQKIDTEETTTPTPTTDNPRKMISIDNLPPLPTPRSLSTSMDDTIFISIPSYRDSECAEMVQQLFTSASRPDRITLGICNQHDPTNASEIGVDFSRLEATGRSFRPEQIRMLSIPWTHASGPCWARALAQRLYRGETYHLQIDSHMRFRKDWDEFLIHELSRCPDAQYAILTTYPRGYLRPNHVETDNEDGVAAVCQPTLLCASAFKDGFLRQVGKTVNGPCTKQPILSLFYAAGFAFSRGQVCTHVPYNPHLQHLFFGEESYMAARLWTSGYNFFAPSETVVFHLWSRDHRPFFREQVQMTKHRRNLQRQARAFVQATLGMMVPTSPRSSESDDPKPDTKSYGLGTSRTLAEYEAFSGISFANQVIQAFATCGGQTQMMIH